MSSETIPTILETWCEFTDITMSGAHATHTFRLDDLFDLDDVIEEPTEPSSEPWPGHTVTGDIGKGGMGVVHKANQRELQRSVALKTPNHPQLHRRFTEEALISGYLNHPNIIAVHNLIHGADNTLALTMPLIDGITWDAKVKSDYAQSTNGLSNRRLNEHLDYLLKVCQAVSYAHHKGILHNDLKLENIMVGHFGDVVVMDWGCATHNPTVEIDLPFHILHPTSITRPFGSPCYMPPELANGQGAQIGTWTDTYLLGAMLYEILEGRPPRHGNTLGDVIELATTGSLEPFQQCTSSTLQQICRRALAPNIEDRYQTPEALEHDLRGYFRAEQSEQLLQSVQNALAQEQQFQYSDSHNALVTLIEAVSMTQQANELWPSQEAKDLRVTASRQLVTRALDMGDLELASAYLNHMPIGQEDLQHSLLRKQRQRQEELDAVARNKRLTRLVLLFTIVGLSVGGALVNQSRQEALRQHAIAEARLVELSSLSDIQTAQQLQSEMDALWPLRESTVPEIERWINTAERLVSRKSTHVTHLEALHNDASNRDAQLLAWELGIVSDLLSDIDAFESKWIPEIKARRIFAMSIQERSIDSVQDRWNDAIQSIQHLPIYNGLILAPQLGLIPLQQNPTSGLWEFAHLQSGTPPEIVDGQYVLTDDTSIILTLLPGSAFWMGANKTGTHNIDPRAKETEGPVHQVELAPFFMSKYEMTQGQWLRMNTHNPAAYPVGTEMEPKPISARHPIEQITWSEANTTLYRYDLQLPTEAQWEYAARGLRTAPNTTPDSNPVFWTGDSVDSLQGTLNIADMGGRRLGSPESWRFEAVLDDGHMVHAPIGSFAANPFGLHDMLGNVWEWCSDRFGEYTLPTEPGTGKRLAPEDAPNLFRGGGFRASSVHVRSADRYSIYATDYSAYDVGLRPARLIE
jgi:serine/threonine protein kinase/formylglycine-generating enzyme required for sulfatase activity